MSGQGQGQGQGGTFGQSQGFNPQSLSGMPGFNNAMQRFQPPQMGGGQRDWMPTTNDRPGFTPPPVDPAMIYGNIPAPPTTNRDGSPYQQRPPTGYSAPTIMPNFVGQNQPLTPAQLAAHMAQRNAITNGYVDPGQKPTPQQLAAHLQANANYTNSYGTPGQVPLPPWLLPR